MLSPLILGWTAFVAVAFWRSTLIAPEPTLLVRDRAGRFVGELPDRGDRRGPPDERLGFWEVGELPERVVAATLAIEDRRFWLHPGVDPIAVARALKQNLTSEERVSGASTLAMQVARLQNPGERGYLRKALEAATAWIATGRYGREGVLRHYLRIVPYGHRIHGIAYAARRYLDKPVEDLSWAEIAFLAAIPQSPSRMDPYDAAGRRRAIRRGREILARLGARGTLPAVELAAANAEIDHLALPWRGERAESALHALLRYDTLVPAELRRTRPLVTSTLDLDLQREVEGLAWRTVRDASDRGAGNAAVLVVDRRSWEVVAAVSSTGYFDAERAGAIDYLRLPRSSGSTLKPFLFAQALERGTITPATVLDDLEPGPSGILNSDARFLGPMLPRIALANSRNVPAVALLARLGLDEGYAFLADLGLHDHVRPAKRYGLGLAIGSLPVTLERLVTAYTTLAGDGTLHELRWYETEVSGDTLKGVPTSASGDTRRGSGDTRRASGDTLQGVPSSTSFGDTLQGVPSSGTSAGKRLLSESTARLVTLFLADPQARLPTFPRMGFSEYPFAVAVKTGTSSRYRDAWTVAWSKRFLVGVWVGHPDERPMTALSGYRIAARLAQSVVERLHGESMDGLEGLEFPEPRGYRSQKLCALSGQRATVACDRVVLEWLPPAAGDLAGLGECAVHRRVAVDRRSDRIATAATPAQFVDVRTYVDLPPRYARWLAASAAAVYPSADVIGDTLQGVPSVAGDTLKGVPQGAQGVPWTASTALPTIEITSPQAGLRLLLDPETPPSQNTLALTAVVEPRVDQLVWYVDGRPFRTVEPPFDLRWPLVAGEHTFQARVPFTAARSRAVTVVVE